MSEEYIWIDIAPGRRRRYRKEDLDRRPVIYGKAPAIRQDTINPVPGVDGRIYESRSALERVADANGAVYLDKTEIADTRRIRAENKAKADALYRQKLRDSAAEIVTDFDLSNKLGDVWKQN